MGLSGRKVKQRIPQDPRNLSWADDAARFGSNYLSKFGWDASKGLGAEGEGRTSHIKVSHKLDMLGIGAGQQRDPNGIAWKQNKDFESLLRRLNETEAQDRAVKAGGDSDETNDDAEETMEVVEKKKRKHKHDGGERSEEQPPKKKKSKKDRRESDEVEQPAPAEDIQVVAETSVTVEVKNKPAALPRHRSHRARAIAAKNMSSKSAAHISEILGIAPTPSTSSSGLNSGADTPQGKLTSLTDDADALGLDKITTSTKSVADYFKEKLNARSGLAASSSSTSESTVDRDPYESPRMGLGSARTNGIDDPPRMGLGASRLSIADNETQRMGLSKFSSLMSTSFLAAASSSNMKPTTFISSVAQDKEEDDAHFSEAEPQEPKKTKKEKEKKRDHAIPDVSDVKEKRSKKAKREKVKTESDEVGEVDETERKRRKKERKERKKGLESEAGQ